MRSVLKPFLLLLLVISLAQVAYGQGQNDGPPFRSGEVVVSGDPTTLPEGTEVIKYLPHANLTVVAVEKGKEWGMVQRYRLKGKRAGLNFIAKASSVPNDPYYEYQWHFSRIQAEQAWDIATGNGVTVAVLDTGLASGGEDGIGCVVSRKDIVNEDFDPSDGDGHGTHVSGTIAQATNNGFGVAGLAYGACIMPVKVLDDNGEGSFADIAEGIFYAIDNNAGVINMSLGTNARFNVSTDPIMDSALDAAEAAGVTVVCAAGNDGWRKNVSYPAIYPTTIAVGATGFNNERVRYSNFGRGLDIMAPGGDVTTDLDGNGYSDGILQETIGTDGWGYYFFQGTSMAAPHVSAVAAMLLAVDEMLTPQQVRERLAVTAQDLGEPGFDTVYGDGLIQAHDALQYGTQVCKDDDNDSYCVEGGDCNDSDPLVHPGALEVCGDGIDNNCSGRVDEGCELPVDNDSDGFPVEEDCDDSNPLVYPGAAEGCDGVDNDCDGTIDEECSSDLKLKGEPCSSDNECLSSFCHPVKGTCK